MTVLADQALALCGLAARVLLWRPDEFWNATPAELAAALGISGGAEATQPQFDRAALARIFGNDWAGQRA
ncbi:phage tail assembly chaperone [Novosphingobium colocasiae]|uniref:phage tail assembly chaperone n=1 Tax=Novosphingobium colocasiae TaxID=1256513 RepID=UPI0035AE863E